jgi:hypothetical protein
MRYQRLTLEAGSIAFSLRFHPNLTVIAGVGAREREGLVGELLGTLSGNRHGTELEILDDNSRRLGVAGDVVMDLESGRDVTAEFAEDGRVDVLRSLGTDLERARRRTRLSATDVAAASRSDALIATLAAIDQERLWTAAEAVRTSDMKLKAEAQAIGADAEIAPIIEEIEERHAAFSAAQQKHESVRHHGLFVGGASALGAVPAALLNKWTALPFVLVSAINLLVSISFRRRMERARKAEQESLAKAGADSYSSFNAQRVSALLDGQQNRQRLVAAAAEHRAATVAWQSLAGEVPAEWALTMRDRVIAISHRVAHTVASGQGTRLDLRSVEPAELAQAFIARLADLRHAGAHGESLPLILDEPLEGVDPAVKQWMLELVGRSAGMPQVVYLTDDPDVAAWARMEAMVGNLDVIEPVSEDASAG